jgi:hypothetical protein
MKSSFLLTNSRIGALVVAVLVIAGCATTTSTMNMSWVNPEHAPTPIKKVLVIGLATDPAMRKTFETSMGATLQKEGVEAVPSFGVMQDLTRVGDEAAARAMVLEAVTKTGADAVTVTRLVREDTSQRVVQGSTYVAPSAYYHNMYGYYYNSYQMVSTPDYVVEDKAYVVETNLYDVATEKLVWTGISETVNPVSAADAVESVGKTIVYTLRREKLIK